jgi:hypothetical protein
MNISERIPLFRDRQKYKIKAQSQNYGFKMLHAKDGTMAERNTEMKVPEPCRNAEVATDRLKCAKGNCK